MELRSLDAGSHSHEDIEIPSHSNKGRPSLSGFSESEYIFNFIVEHIITTCVVACL
jgi:hypothetical protein